MIKSILITLLAMPATAAWAQKDFVPPEPSAVRGVGVDEMLGQDIPLDLEFVAEDGSLVTLDQLLATDMPTILTFNFSSCPQLCSLQLNGLADTLSDHRFQVGNHFQIITISLDPLEKRSRWNEMKSGYIEQLPTDRREGAEKHWHFLTGNPRVISSLADAVGFRYNYNSHRNEYVHAAAYIFLSSRGKVVRYVYGFEIEPGEMTTSVLKSGAAEPTTSAGYMHRCFFYDSDENNYSNGARRIMAYGAGGFVLLLIGFLAFLGMRRIKEELS